MVDYAAPAAAAGPPTPVLPVTRTVDGVVVMEHDADAWEHAPRALLDTVPLFVIGSGRPGRAADPRADLASVSFVVALRDGRTAALAPTGNRLMIFGPDGKSQRSFERTGRAPGDLMAPSGMILGGGDTLLISDPGNNRLNWALPDRGIVAHRPMDVGFAVGTSQIAGALPGGRLVLHSADAPRPGVPDSLVRPPVPILVLGRPVGSGWTISEVPGWEMVPVETRFRGRVAMASRPLRLGRRAHIVVWDTLIATAAGEGYRVDLVNGDGRVVVRLLAQVARRAVTDTMRQARIAEELERLRRSRDRLVDPEETRRLIRESPFADSVPPYEALHVTRGGTLWVVDAIAPGDSGWSAAAFRPDGALLRRLHAAGRGRPLAFADDRVIVRTEDPDSGVRLRAYRLPQ